jgi:hypothetical protein
MRELNPSYDLLASSDVLASFDTTNRVPIQTALAPSMSAAAKLRPSDTPPPATSRTGLLEMGDVYCLQIYAQAGTRMLYGG